jgi:glycine cleavage system regulatory protein
MANRTPVVQAIVAVVVAMAMCARPNRCNNISYHFRIQQDDSHILSDLTNVYNVNNRNISVLGAVTCENIC